jgi:hypothetical protein
LPIESNFSGLSSVAKMTTALMQKKKDIVTKNLQESQRGGFRPIVPRPVQPLVPTRYVSTYVPKVKLPANSYSRGSKFDEISEEIVISLCYLESLQMACHPD